MFLEPSLECQRVSCNCVVSLKSVKQLIYPQLSMVSHGSGNFREYLHLHYRPLPVVPHKAVAEVSKIGNLYERLVVVNQGWQREAADGPKGG
jgi:hypothetical protein